MENICDVLKEKILVCDGAMGTMLYALGIDPQRCYEYVNIERPSLIESLHREYLDAGADIIETNTFGANFAQLLKYGHEKEVSRINIEAARLAKRAASGKAFVAGSVGPLTALGLDQQLSKEDIGAIYKEQILALAEGGVDLFVLETFSSLEHMKTAISICKKETSLPVVAQMAFLDGMRTNFGDGIDDAVAVLTQARADIIGANCGNGPRHMLQVISALARSTDIFLSAQPNAGYPQHVDGRTMYMTSPEYFASSAVELVAAGANIVGGCCGTTPSHIRLAAVALKSKKPAPRRKKDVSPGPRLGQKEGFFKKEDKGRILIVTELLPPRDAETKKMLDTAMMLKNSGASLLSFPDNPLARVRMSSISAAGLVKQKTGLETIFHYTCRDRNLIGLQSDILGAYALGLRAVLAVTGDPVSLGKNPEASAVYDVHSIKLVRMIDSMSKSLKLDINIGVAFNPLGEDMSCQLERLKKKIEAGATFVMTQPLFDKEKIFQVCRKTRELGVPVFVGVLPLTSRKNAEFLHNEVPGMKIPEAIRERMPVDDKERARQVGVDIVLDLIRATKDAADGYYLISPMSFYELSARILEEAARLRKSVRELV